MSLLPREEGWRKRPVWSVKTWLAGGGGKVGIDVVGPFGGGSRFSRVKVFEFLKFGEGGWFRGGRGRGVGGSWRRTVRGGGGVVGVFVVGTFCRLEVCALVVEVALDHGNGCWVVTSDLFGGEVGPRCEEAARDGGAPGGERGREEGNMVEGDATGDDGVGGE